MFDRVVDYIGILSCQMESPVSEIRERLAGESISQSILVNGFGLCAGTIAKPVSYIFEYAKRHNCVTRLITDKDVPFNQRHLCDILELVQDDVQKHELISRVCIGGLVISKGLEIKHLSQCFIHYGKPVAAIKELVNPKQLPSQVEVFSDLMEAINYLIQASCYQSSFPRLELSI